MVGTAYTSPQVDSAGGEARLPTNYQQQQQQQQQQQHHHHYRDHHHHSPKQSLSTLEYNSNIRTTERTDHHHHHDHGPRIPDGFKSSRAFDTSTFSGVSHSIKSNVDNNSYGYYNNSTNHNSNKLPLERISSSSHHPQQHRSNSPQIRSSGVFIRPNSTALSSSPAAVDYKSSNNNINSKTPVAVYHVTPGNSHHATSATTTTYQQQQARNTDVSELFLAEAKAAQARFDLDMQGATEGIVAVDGNGSVASGNSFEATMDNDRPSSHTRHNSLSSIDAVGPNKDNTNSLLHPLQQCHRPLITLQVVDDTVQIATATASNTAVSTTTPQQQQQHDSIRSLQPASFILPDYHNRPDDEGYNQSVYHHQQQHQPQHYRSNRKPLGLAYALRKTDSGSTFQSLDGLSNSLPLIRHESSKKKHRTNKSSSKNGKRKKRSSSSASSTTSAFSSSSTSMYNSTNSSDNGNRSKFNSTNIPSFLKCHPALDYSPNNHFASCFMTTPSCLPIDHITESFDHYRHRYYASTAYNNNRRNNNDTDTNSDHCYNMKNNSPSKQREGPEQSLSSPPSSNTSRVNVQQQHQLHIRDRRSRLLNEVKDDPEISKSPTIYEAKTTTKVITPSPPPPTGKRKKTVRFATPLVTKIKYRPYTARCDIASLFFQEEELEELEGDRETVTGDQFECQYDERALAVHIAYQQINPTDE